MVEIPMDETSAPQVVEELIARAEAARASDVHLQATKDGTDISFRLDGVLAPVSKLPTALAERVFGRIKYLAKLKTYQDSLPQDGRIEKSEAKASRDIRVSTYPTVTGEKLVLRLFDAETAKSFAELGLPPDGLEALQSALRKTSGLLFLTGPAGSGKTSTIYACLRYLVELGGRHIISVEDPVEQIVPGVMQTEINESRGLTFATAARHLLRQDPQVLVIGEVRDEETAQVCLRAASTGHLVISTLHAGSCRGVLDRLLLLSQDRHGILSNLELIVNQRLLRRLCPACHGSGCAECLKTGYKGRLPVIEWVQLNDAMRRQFTQDRDLALQPTKTLEQSAREILAAQSTDQRELQRVFGF